VPASITLTLLTAFWRHCPGLFKHGPTWKLRPAWDCHQPCIRLGLIPQDGVARLGCQSAELADCLRRNAADHSSALTNGWRIRQAHHHDHRTKGRPRRRRSVITRVCTFRPHRPAGPSAPLFVKLEFVHCARESECFPRIRLPFPLDSSNFSALLPLCCSTLSPPVSLSDGLASSQPQVFGIFRPARPGRHHRISSSLSVLVTVLLQHVAAAAATCCGPRPRRRPAGRSSLRTARAAARPLLFCSRCQPASWSCGLLLLARQPASCTCFPLLLALPTCRLALRPPGPGRVSCRARTRSGSPSRIGP
jgi:hypothetical protein